MDLEHRRLDNSDRTHDVKLPVDSDGSQTQRPDHTLEFRPNEFVVYPGHGVGHIKAIEVQTVGGTSLEFFVIEFAKSKMRARVPTKKAASIGMRKLSSPAAIEQIRRTLSQAAPRARMNWSRLTKEYETKIKTGSIIALAEVMRDLHRRTADSEQSYSERQFYTAALDLVSGEVALVENITEEKAASELGNLLTNRFDRTR